MGRANEKITREGPLPTVKRCSCVGFDVNASWDCGVLAKVGLGFLFYFVLVFRYLANCFKITF